MSSEEVRIQYVYQNLPGKRWRTYSSVHIGIGREKTLDQITSADAKEIVLEATYKIGKRRDGSPSFIGPLASGPPSKRFTYITWLEKQSPGCYQMFAAIKVSLFDIPVSAIRESQKEDVPMVAVINMTKKDGHVSCATLKPPDIQWRFQG